MPNTQMANDKKKRLPPNIVKSHNFINVLCCPKCKKTIDNTSYNYCPYCATEFDYLPVFQHFMVNGDQEYDGIY